MLYDEEKGNMTLTATGDLLITRRLSPYKEPKYLEIWDIIKASDIKFTNLEMLVHDYRGYPAAESGGTYCITEPFIVEELKWAGFNLFARANNHTMDYGAGGLIATSENLDRAGLVHAGAGPNMGAARMPAYLDTAAGRAALISSSSSFASWGRAGHSRRDSDGRPGLNPLRYETYFVVDEAGMQKVKDLSELLGYEALKRKAQQSGFVSSETAKENEFKLFQYKFVLGDKPGVYTRAHPGDVEENLRWIKDAKRQADWVVYSLHAHEGDMERTVPAKFVEPFAHDCIDAGCAAFIGHGPHLLRGMEIYRGAPIFYSLGNFVFQNESVRKLPYDVYEQYNLDDTSTPADLYDARTKKDTRGFPADRVYWESVLPVCRWENWKLVDLKLYPLTLGFGKTRQFRGRPLIATGELAEKIIGDMINLSKPFGTEIEYRDGLGVVKI